MLLGHFAARLVVGGVFSTAGEFDLAVRRYNQGINKLLKLRRRNKTTVHHICLAQARERERVSAVNKGRKRNDYEKPKPVCSGAWVAIKKKPKPEIGDCEENLRTILTQEEGY